MAITVMGLGDKVRFMFQDETRIGLKTISGRKITARGVKPIGLRWDNPRNLDELRILISEQLEKMSLEVIASITGRSYILEALSVVGI